MSESERADAAATLMHGDGQPSVSLYTQRLLLRPFVASDLADWARITADPQVSRHITPEPPDRPAAWRTLAQMIGHWQLRGFGLWAAVERASGRLVGRIGLHRPEGWPGLEVGWLLARDRWGLGLATEGARAAADWAFDVLGASELISIIDPHNLRSIRVAERLGETLRRRTLLGGRELLVYGIDRPDGRPQEPSWVTHSGGCHCRAVRFEVQASAHLDVLRCCCSRCLMTGPLQLLVPGPRFELLTPESSLSTFQPSAALPQHLFCARCGVQSFHVPPSAPGGFSVDARCLDAATVRSIRVSPFGGSCLDPRAAAP